MTTTSREQERRNIAKLRSRFHFISDQTGVAYNTIQAARRLDEVRHPATTALFKWTEAVQDNVAAREVIPFLVSRSSDEPDMGILTVRSQDQEVFGRLADAGVLEDYDG